MRSSSAVVTPGATAPAAARRAAATAWPASPMAASCPAVLICVPGLRRLTIVPPDPLSRYPDALAHEAPQRAQRALGNLVHRPGRVKPQQDALVGVERDQRRRLQLVDLDPVPDRVLAIVVALEQL